MIASLLLACNSQSTSDSTIELTDGLVAHYPLNNDSFAKDWTTNYDATDNGATFYDTYVDTSSFSITLPTIDNELYYSYFEDIGSGFSYVYTSSKPTLSTNKFSNLRVYDRELSEEEQTILEEEGLIPSLPKPTEDGLVAYYPLTGSADDYLQNYNGAENSVEYEEDSEYGAVASFDGDDDYINISPLDFEWNTPFSILVWISESSFTSNENSIVEISSGDYPYDTAIVMGGRVDIQDSDRRLYIRNYVNNEVYIGNESAKHPLNTWRHLVFEWDGTNLFGFEDGKLLGSNAFSFSNPHSSSNILKYLGTSAVISRFLDGKLSNIRFYNRALSEEEVLNIYKYERVQHSINIDSGLVAYYPLKQNSNDNFVNQYDGTDYNVTYDGQSAIFDGNDSIALPTTITPTTGIPYTISAWFKLDVLGVYQTIISLNSLGLDYNASIRISDTNKMFLFGQSGTTTLSGDTWYHACVVSDGSTARMYLDYSEECNNSFIANIYSDGLSLIGARKYSSSAEDEKCNGSIAKVRIYDKALTEEEITAIYNLEKGDFGL